jgi:hypothetical protein
MVQIPNAAFTQALRTAIEESKLFAKVDNSISEGYRLEVRIMGYDPPRGGVGMTASLTTYWKLTRTGAAEVLFEDFVKATYRATMGDAVVGATRWRKANEGVARETIKEGIRLLSELKL